MNQVENVKSILEAIDSLRDQAKAALRTGEIVQFRQHMDNLKALGDCLEAQVRVLVKEVDHKDAA